ncbi:unnamed protein product [Trichobilharzia szidati]|nr:unnamed protein product [Trichobilharzia szidati]
MNIKDDISSLLTEARLKCEEGDYKESLNLCQKAYALDPSPNILRKIERLQKFLNDETKENSPVISTESNSPVKEAARHFLNEAKKYEMSGKIDECINLLKEAYLCDPSDEIQAKIEEMKQAIDRDNPPIPLSSVISQEDKVCFFITE